MLNVARGALRRYHARGWVLLADGGEDLNLGLGAETQSGTRGRLADSSSFVIELIAQTDVEDSNLIFGI